MNVCVSQVWFCFIASALAGTGNSKCVHDSEAITPKSVTSGVKKDGEMHRRRARVASLNTACSLSGDALTNNIKQTCWANGLLQ